MGVLVLPVGSSQPSGALASSLRVMVVSVKRLTSFLLPTVGSCGQMMPMWLAMFMEGPF